MENGDLQKIVECLERYTHNHVHILQLQIEKLENRIRALESELKSKLTCERCHKRLRQKWDMIHCADCNVGGVDDIWFVMIAHVQPTVMPASVIVKDMPTKVARLLK